MNIVELKDVCYSRSGMAHPLKGINLLIKPGEIVHLCGDIGAGKSTLIDVILGIKRPDSGDVKVFGSYPGLIETRFLTGVVPQRLRSPIKNAQLGMLTDLIESHYPGAKGKVNSILKDLEFDLSNNKEELSGGEERLLFFSLAQAGSPKLLILDEPTTFLDSIDRPNRDSKQTKLWRLLQKFADGGNTILLICHDKEIGIQATRTLLLDNGQLNELYGEQQSLKQTNSDKSDKIESVETKFSHWVFLFFKHVRFNIRQTFRTDQKYILITLLSSLLVAVCVSSAAKLGDAEGTSKLFNIAQAFSFYLALTAANSTGNIIAEERQNEFFTRLLKILPLPPMVYLSAKVVSSMLLISLIAFGMLFTALLFNVVSLSTFPYLWVGFVLGSIPYLFLGFVLGYLFDKPKTIQTVALICSLALSIPIFVRPLLTAIGITLGEANNLNLIALLGDNIAAHSPVYHYIQLMLYLGKAPEYDQYLWLHLSWLFWFICAFLILALEIYRYVSSKEAKT